jgi:hypothetical protein
MLSKLARDSHFTQAELEEGHTYDTLWNATLKEIDGARKDPLFTTPGSLHIVQRDEAQNRYCRVRG